MAQIMRRISNSLNGARDLISSAGGNLKKGSRILISFSFMENSGKGDALRYSYMHTAPLVG